MITQTWVDPVDVVVATTCDNDGNCVWAYVVADTPFPEKVTSSQVGTCTTRVDAYIEAMASITTRYRDTGINIYSIDEGFISSVQQLRAWPNVEAHPPSSARSHPAARELTELIGQFSQVREPIVIACDGSHSASQNTGGWAWVNSEGEFSRGAGYSSSSVHSELEAVDLALRMHSPVANQQLRILVDSKDAIALIERGPRDTTSTRIRKTLIKIRARASFASASFEWVHAHNGDPLNEAANRLAIAARRDADAHTPDDTSHEVASSIVSEHLDAFRRGQLVTPTTAVGVAV